MKKLNCNTKEKFVPFMVFILLVTFCQFSYGQNDFSTSENTLLSNEILHIPKNGSHQFPSIPLEYEQANPFFTLVVKLKEKNEKDILNNCWIRFSVDGVDWSGYKRVLKDSHETSSRRYTMSDLIFAKEDARFFQLKIITSHEEIIDLEEMKVIVNSVSLTDDRDMNESSTLREDCTLPDMQARGEWCTFGECPVIVGGTTTDVSHLIVHHSAGVTESSNWAAVVKSIWHYHVDTKGWDDIGYNWLIDANGVLYEGRPDNIRGAHMCGRNTGTMGVCILGNFEEGDNNISEEAAITLEELLAWKCKQKEIDPEANEYHESAQKNIMTIAGHKDGCDPGYTQCPGVNFYPLLSDIRTNVDEILSSCVSSLHDEEVISELKLINNIALDVLNIQHNNESYQYLVYDMNGRSIISHSNYNENSISLPILPSNIYFIRLMNKRQSNVFRFVIP